MRFLLPTTFALSFVCLVVLAGACVLSANAIEPIDHDAAFRFLAIGLLCILNAPFALYLAIARRDYL